jgi:hypothetical protein
METRCDDFLSYRPHDRVMLARFANFEWPACPWCAALMIASVDVADAPTEEIGAGEFDGCACRRCGRRFLSGEGWY